jgi:hypothetical protein
VLLVLKHGLSSRKESNKKILPVWQEVVDIKIRLLRAIDFQRSSCSTILVPSIKFIISMKDIPML